MCDVFEGDGKVHSVEANGGEIECNALSMRVVFARNTTVDGAKISRSQRFDDIFKPGQKVMFRAETDGEASARLCARDIRRYGSETKTGGAVRENSGTVVENKGKEGTGARDERERPGATEERGRPGSREQRGRPGAREERGARKERGARTGDRTERDGGQMSVDTQYVTMGIGIVIEERATFGFLRGIDGDSVMFFPGCAMGDIPRNRTPFHNLSRLVTDWPSENPYDPELLTRIKENLNEHRTNHAPVRGPPGARVPIYKPDTIVRYFAERVTRRRNAPPRIACTLLGQASDADLDTLSRTEGRIVEWNRIVARVKVDSPTCELHGRVVRVQRSVIKDLSRYPVPHIDEEAMVLGRKLHLVINTAVHQQQSDLRVVMASFPADNPPPRIMSQQEYNGRLRRSQSVASVRRQSSCRPGRSTSMSRLRQPDNDENEDSDSKENGAISRVGRDPYRGVRLKRAASPSIGPDPQRHGQRSRAPTRRDPSPLTAGRVGPPPGYHEAISRPTADRPTAERHLHNSSSTSHDSGVCSPASTPSRTPRDVQSPSAGLLDEDVQLTPRRLLQRPLLPHKVGAALQPPPTSILKRPTKPTTIESASVDFDKAVIKSFLVALDDLGLEERDIHSAVDRREIAMQMRDMLHKAGYRDDWAEQAYDYGLSKNMF